MTPAELRDAFERDAALWTHHPTTGCIAKVKIARDRGVPSDRDDEQWVVFEGRPGSYRRDHDTLFPTTTAYWHAHLSFAIRSTTVRMGQPFCVDGAHPVEHELLRDLLAHCTPRLERLERAMAKRAAAAAARPPL